MICYQWTDSPKSQKKSLFRLFAQQTASGLEADLGRCLTEWQSHGRIEPLPPGADDSSDRLPIPEKLYEREREVSALIAAFDRERLVI
jgi:hypothetical protein